MMNWPTVFFQFLGEYTTTARWMRDYIRSHEDYKQDSHVSEKIMYDLAVTCDGISRGKVDAPKLFGEPKTKSMNIIQPRCAKVSEEVEKVTMELNNPVKKAAVDTIDDQLNKAIGIGVISGPGNIQM